MSKSVLMRIGSNLGQTLKVNTRNVPLKPGSNIKLSSSLFLVISEGASNKLSINGLGAQMKGRNSQLIGDGDINHKDFQEILIKRKFGFEFSAKLSKNQLEILLNTNTEPDLFSYKLEFKGKYLKEILLNTKDFNLNKLCDFKSIESLLGTTINKNIYVSAGTLKLLLETNKFSFLLHNNPVQNYIKNIVRDLEPKDK